MEDERHPLIYTRLGARGPRPALRGTRLDVAQIVATVRQNNNSVQEAADYLEIPGGSIQAVMDYYSDHRADIDEEIRVSAAFAETVREMLERPESKKTRLRARSRIRIDE